MTMRSPLVAALALVLSAGALPALAQQKPERPEPPLKGPPVRNNRPAALEDRFVPGRDGNRGAMAQRGIQIREFHRILESMRAEDAPKEIRLSDEQDRRVRAIMEDFRRQQRTAGAPGEAARPRRDGENRPPKGEAPRRPAQKQREAGAPREGGAPMEKMSEGGAGPQGRPQDAITRVWAVLTEPQQAYVTAEMQKIRKEMDQKRDEEMVKRRIEERKAGEGQRPGAPEGQNAGEPGRAPERLRRIAERLRDLPPEERERILQMLEQEIDKAEKP